MRQKAHKRSRMIGTSVAASLALLLGGGGLVIMNTSANASHSTRDGGVQQKRASAWRAATIDCPEVADRLRVVPNRARREVDRNLAQLDSQVAEAYKRLRNSRRSTDRQFVNSAILGPLAEKRRATINRISIAIGRFGQRPQGLERLAQCQAKQDPAADNQNGAVGGNNGDQNNNNNGGQNGDGGQNNNGGQGDNGGQNGNGQQGIGPFPDDFVDITKVQPNVRQPRQRRNASTGTFTTECGRNENGLFNPDNVIVSPGVSNGAHHMHDYVGNQGNDAFATNESLAAAATSCVNQDDKSSYFWPVLRVQNGRDEDDANSPGGGLDNNIGEILTPRSVTLTFEGSPVSKVVEMPRFLRIITGDAKAFTNGPANANASWSCTGFEDRQLKDKYPICPQGSEVVRTFRFQSCWDGQNIDSANHRTHVAFANENGECPNGFRAIPQMVQRITYEIPQGLVYAVDAFPEQLHKPITDHGDFINVMSEDLMRKAVNCINTGRNCRN